jgi:alkanesulfonate monooxygenase SsuD/methylene tetrahydromethanopterin reductase-like flavin-dependent oxidoreductase (luciferase family)
MVRIREFQLEFTPPYSVPIFLAGLGPRMLQLAGAIADGAILTWFPPARVGWARAQVADGARRAGRAPSEITIVTTARVCAADDADRAAAARVAARRQLATYAGLPVYARMWRESGFAVSVDRITSALPAGIEAAAEKVPDAMLETFVAIGDRSRLRSHLRGYLAGGADVVLAYPLPVGEDAVASVRETQRAAAPGEARPGQESSAGPENARSEDRS